MAVFCFPTRQDALAKSFGEAEAHNVSTQMMDTIAYQNWRYKMEPKLYVGNLSYDTTEEELRSLFSQAGTVSEVAMIKDRNTGQPKGFAFVTMSNKEEATKAIQMFSGRSLGNRELTVNEARPREERTGGYDSNRGGGYRSNSPRGGQRDGGNRRY